MEMLFARQPIFTVDNKVIGYELLYRNELENDTSSNLEKTVDVLTNVNTFFSNFDAEMSSKKIFLNFDRTLLLDNIVDVLSPTDHIIEILESVKQDRITINRIIQLKRLGFKIAIDDYTIDYPNEEFVNLADYIKVDFIANTIPQIIELSKREKFLNKTLLAEKVENENMHHLALELNYKLFQGYYYAKPIVHKGNYISVNVKTCLEILTQLNSPQISDSGDKFVDLYKIARHMEKDPVLSFKILQIANAVRANLYIKIDSILRAVTLLGYRKLNKWLKIILFQEVKTRGKKNKQNINLEVIRTIIIRTAFVENLLTENRKLSSYIGESVLVLMVDLFDILFEMSLEDIVSSLDLSQDISEALINDKGILSVILNIVRNFEDANWEEVERLCKQIGLKYDNLGKIYMKSLEDSKDILEELSKEDTTY